MLSDRFYQHIKQNFASLMGAQQTWLLAVSGGLDSVVLCHLAHTAGINFVIAHCNFQLRGNESNRDEEFVREMGGQYNKLVLVKHFDTAAFAEQQKKSIQVAARELRYQWFYQLLQNDPAKVDGTSIHQTAPSAALQLSPTIVVTAHHADDNVETLLMNFFKGTGMSGLHGILPLQKQLLRPLLPFTKEELLQYASEQKLEFVEDSSNTSLKYTRNNIRQQVMPLLKSIYPAINENLRNNIERFAEAELLYRQALDQHKKKLLEHKGNEVHIPVLKLLHVQPLNTIVHEIIKDYGFTPAQVKEVIRLLQSESGKYVTSASHMVLRNRKWLIISRLQTADATTIVIENADTMIAFREGTLQLQSQKASDGFVLPTALHQCCIDSSKVQFPLLLRPWKQGDYFYPLGMEKKKKLSRFLIDNKVSKNNKEKVWVLESDKKIIWVIGYRIDNRFKVLPSAKHLLCITYTASQMAG